jgi:hypothetical protein
MGTSLTGATARSFPTRTPATGAVLYLEALMDSIHLVCLRARARLRRDANAAGVSYHQRPGAPCLQEPYWRRLATGRLQSYCRVGSLSSLARMGREGGWLGD